MQDSAGDIIPRLRNSNEILFSSSDRSSYREYTVDGTTITEETEPWTDSDDDNTVQAEMVEVKGGPFEEEPIEEIYAREMMAAFNYGANLQGISTRGVAEIDLNLSGWKNKRRSGEVKIPCSWRIVA